MSTQKVDLIGQYIGQILIPRLNTADRLYANRNYVDAVDTQIRIIKALYRNSEEEKKKLVKWTEKFDIIKVSSKKVLGRAECMTYWKQAERLSFLAKKLYDELDWEIWNYLHGLGYFSMEHYSFVDPARGKKSGRSKKYD